MMDIFGTPRFNTAQGTVEHWQDQRLVRDAMIRWDAFRTMHAKQHREAFPPHAGARD